METTTTVPLTATAAAALASAPEGGALDRRMRAARLARTAFGAALVAGGACLFVATTLVASLKAPGTEAIAMDSLKALWPVALLAGALAWVVGLLVRNRKIDERGLALSVALPLAGLALVVPLTVHAAIWVAFMKSPHERLAEFNGYVLLSAAIVGHVHLALAGMMARRAYRIANGEQPLSIAKVYGITVALSLVPGVIFMAIPPIFVALTGLPFIALMGWGDRILARERR